MKRILSRDKQQGQVILLLLLVMVVALAIGLSLVQRSLTDVSTASKNEQSTRAFSAAEAGIEKALNAGSSIGSVDLGNSAAISRVTRDSLPAAHQALEYPPLAREDIAHIWLADPNSNDPTDAQPAKVYDRGTLEIYWGKLSGTSPSTLLPAIEISVVAFAPPTGPVTACSLRGYCYWGKFFIDSDGSRALLNNHFQDANNTTDSNISSSGCRTSGYTPPVTSGVTTTYYCKLTLRNLPGSTGAADASRVILLRARYLYITENQPFAVNPTGSGSLPPQAQRYISTGTSGDIQRKIQLFQVHKVVPFYFDYAIFSEGAISK